MDVLKRLENIIVEKVNYSEKLTKTFCIRCWSREMSLIYTYRSDSLVNPYQQWKITLSLLNFLIKIQENTRFFPFQFWFSFELDLCLWRVWCWNKKPQRDCPGFITKFHLYFQNHSFSLQLQILFPYSWKIQGPALYFWHEHGFVTII